MKIILVFLLGVSTVSVAQNTKLVTGDLQLLRNQVAVNFEFVYDTLQGDVNHNNSFERRFLQSFMKQTGLKINENAPYTLILHTLPAAPLKDDTVSVVETQHKVKRIAQLAVPKSQDKTGKALGKFIDKVLR